MHTSHIAIYVQEHEVPHAFATPHASTSAPRRVRLKFGILLVLLANNLTRLLHSLMPEKGITI